MELYNNLLGWSQAGSTTDRCANDTPENLKKNLSKQPADWYYQDKEIYYKWNSTGHRCKEISDIDLSNYILTIGCSHTVGVGLELEKSYPYVLLDLGYNIDLSPISSATQIGTCVVSPIIEDVITTTTTTTAP